MKTIDLSGFYGTENYYKHPLVQQFLYTDGVKYFCDKAQAYWFLDIVATEYLPLLKTEEFLTVLLEVHSGSATITVTDGDYRNLKSKRIEFTDCPEDQYLFFLTGSVFMLSSEY
jgi:hypothetical protein